MNINKELDERLIELKKAEDNLLVFKRKEQEFKELKNEVIMFIAEQKHQLIDIMKENKVIAHKVDNFCDVKLQKPTSSVEVSDLNAVPNEYLITTTSIRADKEKIKTAIEISGERITGIDLKIKPILKIAYV